MGHRVIIAASDAPDHRIPASAPGDRAAGDRRWPSVAPVQDPGTGIGPDSEHHFERGPFMKLTVTTFLTLDGVMQAPGAADEDTSGGFTAGGWQVPYTDDEDFGEIVMGWFQTPHVDLLGRNTFEMFKSFWPQVDDSDPVAREINSATRYVVAHAGYQPDWGDTTVIDSSDALPAIERLKAEGEGELVVSGSAQLAAALHGAGMIDEYQLLIFPVVVGGGKRLFADGSLPRGFQVHRTRTTPSGAVLLVLTPEPFRSGDYAVEDGQEVTRMR